MPRAGLTPEAVLDAAENLADERGLDAVSLAELAARLGVRAPSLYKHLAGLAGVLDGLALRGLREAERRLARATAGLAGEEALIALATTYFTFGREHPGLYAATVRAPRAAAGPEMAKAAEDLVGTVLAVLRGYRLSGDDALHATRILRATVHGFLALEAAGGFGLPLAVAELFRRAVHLLAGGLADPRLYPRDA